MNGANRADVFTVFNKPFFVNELLEAVHPDVITPQIFAAMEEESRAFDLNTILTAMTRQIDISGVVPNLAGTYDDPQSVFEVLTNLGHQQLLKIARMDASLQTEIFDTLKGDDGTTLRALLVLDEIQQEIICQLVQIRQQSPLALAIRQATEAALRALYREPKNLVSPVFDGIIGYEVRLPLYQGEPRICYPKRVSGGAVVEVWQYFFMTKIRNVRLPAAMGHHTVSQILEKITPHIYIRHYVDDSMFDPKTPAGFMGLIGKVGEALPRLIAKQVKKDDELKEKVMQEQELARVLYELFTR